MSLNRGNLDDVVCISRKSQLGLYIFLREIAGRPSLQIIEEVFFQQKHLGQVFFNHINRTTTTIPESGHLPF
ncbi:MAG: hypothetical protein M3Y25_01080 [Thermoproteota archaeon]|nr:hypothetical protein [Thermoproteota archaeon]